MRAITHALCGTFGCLSVFALHAAAQCIDRPLPTSGSTRALAMGDANLAGRDDDVIFYGPAQLAVARGTSVAAERYMDGLAGGTVATTSRLASGGIGVGAEVVEGRNPDSCLQLLALPNGLPAARTISRDMAVVGAAQTYKRTHVGLSAKYATQQADEQRTSQFLFDVGASHDYSLGDFVPLTAAIAVQNIGGSRRDAAALGQPFRATVGLATGGPLGAFDVALATQFGVERADPRPGGRVNDAIARGGLEVGYTWLDGYSIAVRAGERTNTSITLARHLTFGAGLVLDRLSFDWAVEDLAGSRYAQRFGIRLR